MWKRRLETGTGFAYAKLSEILHCARVARFVQDDRAARVVRFVRITHTFARVARYRQDDKEGRLSRGIRAVYSVGGAVIETNFHRT